MSSSGVEEAPYMRKCEKDLDSRDLRWIGDEWSLLVVAATAPATPPKPVAKKEESRVTPRDKIRG